MNLALSISSVVISVFSAVISSIALVFSYLGFRHARNRVKAEKAHEMARFFEQMIPEIGTIMSALNSFPEILRLVNNVDELKIDSFNRSEMRKIFLVEDVNELEKFFVRADEAFIDADVQGEFRKLISRCLNQLEWFAMAFICKLADDDLVYQSLHQLYMETVKLLYFRIAWENQNTHDKYFTSMIALYRCWRKRRQKDILRLEKREQKNDRISRKAAKRTAEKDFKIKSKF